MLDLIYEFIYAYLYIIGLVLGAGCLIMIASSIVCLILMLIFGLVLGAAILFIKIFLFSGLNLTEPGDSSTVGRKFGKLHFQTFLLK